MSHLHCSTGRDTHAGQSSCVAITAHALCLKAYAQVFIACNLPKGHMCFRRACHMQSSSRIQVLAWWPRAFMSTQSNSSFWPHSWEKEKISRALHNSTESTSIVSAEVAWRLCSTCSFLRLPWGRGAHSKATIELWRRGAHWRLRWPHVHVLHRLLLRLLEVRRRCIVWWGLQHC